MQNISKRLIVAIIVLIIAIGGWFWYASVQKKQIQKQQQTIQTETNEVSGNDDTGADYKNRVANEMNASLDKSHWQTYRNEKLKIEFQYPDGWMVEELDFFDFLKITVKPNPSNILSQEDYSSYVYLAPVRDAIDFNTAQKLYSNHIGIKYDGYSSSKIDVNTINGLQYPLVQGMKIVENAPVSLSGSSTVFYSQRHFIAHFMYFFGKDSQNNEFMKSLLQEITSTLKQLP